MKFYAYLTAALLAITANSALAIKITSGPDPRVTNNKHQMSGDPPSGHAQFSTHKKGIVNEYNDNQQTSILKSWRKRLAEGMRVGYLEDINSSSFENSIHIYTNGLQCLEFSKELIVQRKGNMVQLSGNNWVEVGMIWPLCEGSSYIPLSKYNAVRRLSPEQRSIYEWRSAIKIGTIVVAPSFPKYKDVKLELSRGGLQCADINPNDALIVVEVNPFYIDLARVDNWNMGMRSPKLFEQASISGLWPVCQSIRKD